MTEKRETNLRNRSLSTQIGDQGLSVTIKVLLVDTRGAMGIRIITPT